MTAILNCENLCLYMSEFHLQAADMDVRNSVLSVKVERLRGIWTGFKLVSYIGGKNYSFKEKTV